MATIGVSIESGALHTVLFSPGDGDVIADRTPPLDGGAAKALPSAISDMRAVAAERDVDVDAIGVVYRAEAERRGFEAALGELSMPPVSMVTASSAFLGWLARSPEFADATAVLLYYMGPNGVSISLADAAGASLSQPKAMALDSMSPERIGSTIPLAWEVLDEAGTKPDSVALFGDRSSNRDLLDILALGLGVPVVRVGDPDLIAASGAALRAHVDSADVASIVPVAPAAVAAREDGVAVPQPTRSPRPISRHKFVLAGALLVGLLSGGVALAATLPGQQSADDESSADTTSAGADLLGAYSLVEPTESSPATTIPPAFATVVPDTRPAADVPVVNPTTDPTTTPPPVAVTSNPPAWTPAPAPAPDPAPALTTVDAPQFTIPVVIPEPGKSQEQLEQEAWDRHWQHTGQWLQQELAGK